jgi:uncharacterized protein with GYD domain
MIFITLVKFRKKPTKEFLAESSKLVQKAVAEGLKILGMYWLLGRYDAVLIWEAPDEKMLMKASIRWGDYVSLETLVAVPREEAVKLVE